MRIGWIKDIRGYEGGAELEAAYLEETAPDWAEIVFCPADNIATDVDAYVIHNCMNYSGGLVATLEKQNKPVIKRVYDVWQAGNHDLRNWLLTQSAAVIFSSYPHFELFGWPVKAPKYIIPAALNLQPFIAARDDSKEREGVIWLGRLERGKGLENVSAWADENGLEVDVYGYGSLQNQISKPLNYIGEVDYCDVPELLASYEKFVFLPDAFEPFSRTTVEAWAAGCEMVVNGNVGAVSWIQVDSVGVMQGAAMFWDIVEQIV